MRRAAGRRPQGLNHIAGCEEMQIMKNLFSRAVVRRIIVWVALSAMALPLSAATQRVTILAEGTRFATPCYVLESGVDGPVVMIVGGIHGNEPAGALAAEEIRRWPIVRGKLIVVPRANVPGLVAKSRSIPDVDKASNNLNRNFPKMGKTGPAAGEPATALWKLVRREHPGWLVDLHEGVGVRKGGSTSAGSSAIACRTPEAERAATRMLETVNRTIDDEKQKFVRLGPPVDGSLARAAGEHLGAQAIILETTSQNQPLSRRSRQHRLMVHRLLADLKMIDETLEVDRIFGHERKDGAKWAAIYDAGGTGGTGAANADRLLGATGMRVFRVGSEEIAAGSLDGSDLLVVPGGSGSKEAAAIGEKGREKIVAFVKNGGGYLGICAGAYLALGNFDWSLKIIDAKTVSPKWERGKGTVKIELTAEGRLLLGDRPGLLDVLYHNGPIVEPGHLDKLPEFQTLAYFRSEIAERGVPVGIMVDSPAIFIGRFGKGRVMCISPHPEQTSGLDELVQRAGRWAAGGEK